MITNNSEMVASILSLLFGVMFWTVVYNELVYRNVGDNGFLIDNYLDGI